jgi:hypothetical protein
MARGPRNDKRAAEPSIEEPKRPLDEEVREALLGVLRSGEASAAAKASAGRTLMEYFGERARPAERTADELSEAELDAEIKRLTRKETGSDQ